MGESVELKNEINRTNFGQNMFCQTKWKEVE